MRNFPSMHSKYIPSYQLHYKSLNTRNNASFCADRPDTRDRVLTAVSFSCLSGSLDGVNCTLKTQFFSQNLLQYIQETSLPTKAAPAQRSPQSVLRTEKVTAVSTMLTGVT